MTASLSRRLTDNTTALIVTTALNGIVRLGSNLILSRLLYPEAFAIVGLIVSVFFVLELSSDMGFHAYIVRHKDGAKAALLDTLWTIRLLRGIGLALVMMATSWPLAHYFDSSELQPVFFVSAFVLLIQALHPLSDFISDRQNHVAKPLYLELLAYCLSTIAVIITAYVSHSHWALILGLFLQAIFLLILGYTCYPDAKRSFRIVREYTGEFFDFAKVVIPSSIITIILMQGDKAIIGRTLSITELGLYFIALNFSAIALNLIITYPRRVLYPVLAETFRETPDQLRDVFYQKKTITLIALLFCLGLGAGGAKLLFALLYDDRYLNAAIYLSILLLNPILCALSYPAETCIVATGRIKVSLICNILRLIWLTPACYLGYMKFGSLGIVGAFALVELLPIVYLFIKLSIEKRLKPFHEAVLLVAAVLGFIVANAMMPSILPLLNGS